VSRGGPEVTEPLRSLLDQWTVSLAQVLESMTDQKPTVKWQSGITLAADPEALWWEQDFHISPDARVWIAAPQPTWEHAGSLTLKAAGLETVEISEARSTWLEILSQSLGAMARSISQLIGREVTCAAGTEREPETVPENGGAVVIRFNESALPPLWMGFSPSLVSVICSPLSASTVETGAEETGGQAPESLPSPRTTFAPATMDLILDVELPVSISFGKTEMPMKDVLKLTTGSIVELNRGVNEAVEVLVNHCLIARGEVVVVEGNYGVRIQQIASRLDRIRSLR